MKMAERFIVQGNCHFPALAGFQKYFYKSFQFLCRTVNGRFLCAHINLCNFRSVHFSGIRYLKENCDRILPVLFMNFHM